jgi:hypothetical protein
VRKIIGWVLLGLGGFFLVAALLARFWAPGEVEKTPLDVNSATRLAGTADKLNPASGEVEALDVKATSITKADSEASDDEVVVFVNTTCLVIDEGNPPDCVDAKDPQKRLITASHDVFATDRETAQAVNGDYLPEGATEHEGLVNKWPFNTEQTDYEYWDGLLGEAVPATFEGVDEINGMETYEFLVDVPETSAEVVADTEGLYTSEKHIWIEPKTGTIIDQTQQETRTLDNGDPLLELDIEFTDEQVATNVADTEASLDQLNLISKTIPLVGLVGGIVLLLVGGFLVLMGRRSVTTARTQTRPEYRDARGRDILPG